MFAYPSSSSAGHRAEAFRARGGWRHTPPDGWWSLWTPTLPPMPPANYGGWGEMVTRNVIVAPGRCSEWLAPSPVLAAAAAAAAAGGR